MKRIYLIAVVAVVAVVVVGAVAWALLPSNSNKGTIYYMKVAPNLQADQISAGQISGGVAWEPYASQAVLTGKGHVLYWSSDVWPHHPCCVIAVSQSFANAHPDVVKAFLKAHIEANKWIANAMANPTGANYSLLLDMGAQFSLPSIYASNQTLAREIVNSSLQHMTLTYNLTSSFTDGLKNFTNDFIALNQTSTASLNAAGYSSVDDFITKYVNTSYLAAADVVTPSSGPLVNVNVGYLTGDLHQFARIVASNATVGGGTSLFAKYGINAIAANPGGYAAGPNEMDAFGLGSVDIGYLGAPPAIIKHLNAQIPTMIIAAVNEEGSALVVSSSIHSLADLNGKIVGDPGLGSIQHLLLQEIAKDNGYTLAVAPA